MFNVNVGLKQISAICQLPLFSVPWSRAGLFWHRALSAVHDAMYVIEAGLTRNTQKLHDCVTTKIVFFLNLKKKS